MMGERYIHNMLTTPHKNCVSRKNTMAVDRSNPMPRLKRNRQINPKGSSNNAGLSGAPVISITARSGIKEKSRLMLEESTLESG